MCIRDSLLPEKLAEVNERTHSPVPAILLVMGIVTAMLAWSVWSTDFNTWLALGVLAGVFCVLAYPPLALGSADNTWWVPAFMGMIIVVGLVVYYGAKLIRSSRGVD